MRALRLEARGRVRQQGAVAVQTKGIACTGADVRDETGEVPVTFRRQGERRVGLHLQHDLDIARTRGPDAEMYPASIRDFGPNRKSSSWRHGDCVTTARKHYAEETTETQGRDRHGSDGIGEGGRTSLRHRGQGRDSAASRRQKFYLP